MTERREDAWSRARAASKASRIINAIKTTERLDAAEEEWAQARESYRQAIVALHYVDGLSQTEIAALVERSRSSISNLLRRQGEGTAPDGGFAAPVR